MKTRMPDLEQVKACSSAYVLALNETMNILNGKWKLPIIGKLQFGKLRFRELERAIPKISPRMLSQELKDLEANGIISRTVFSTMPVTIEYELTNAGKSFGKVLEVMLEWGLAHRKQAFAKVMEHVDSSS